MSDNYDAVIATSASSDRYSLFSLKRIKLETKRKKTLFVFLLLSLSFVVAVVRGVEMTKGDERRWL